MAYPDAVGNRNREEQEAMLHRNTTSDRPRYEAYVEQVKGPGKFEGEQPYVPYYWDRYLDGGADRDDGTVLGFDVTIGDKALFPELKGRRTVKLNERDDGFVVEV